MHIKIKISRYQCNLPVDATEYNTLGNKTPSMQNNTKKSFLTIVSPFI